MTENSTHIANTITFDPEANPGLMLPYTLVDDVLRHSVDFNNGLQSEQGEYLLKEFFDFADAMQSVPGHLGVFATGHPFYAFGKNNSVVAVPEIDRFIKETREKFREDSALFGGKWACAACQVQNKLPDLKEFCKPCDIVEAKPRDLFKALPDLDFWVVVDANDAATEKLVAEKAQKAGFYQSDTSIFRSVRDTNRVLQAINNIDALKAGHKPDARLPIDLHIVTRAEFEQSMEDLRVNADVGRPVFVPIQPRSLHVDWERADEPYNFAQDFLFSFTEANFDRDLEGRIQSLRRELGERFTNGQLAHMVIDNDSKSARQLADKSMLSILADRLNEWREL